MTKEHKVRIILHGLEGQEREAEKTRLLTKPSKIETELKRRRDIFLAKGQKGNNPNWRKTNNDWNRERHVRFQINFTPAEWLFVTRNAEKRGFRSISAYIISRLVAVKR